jgi:hypothetical protein
MTVVAEIHLIGDDASKPAASAANNGYLYTSTDVNGGTTYRSNGSAWVQIAAGVTPGGAILASLIDAEGDLIIGTAADTAGRLAVGTAGYAVVSRSSRPAYEAQYAPYILVIDGGGSAITTGVKLDVEVPYAMQLVSWTLLADQAGAIKIDVWRDTYANYPPTDADSLTNAHEPEIAASGAKAQDTDLSDWTDTTLDAGDTLRLNVDSCTTIQRASLCFKVLRL